MFSLLNFTITLEFEGISLKQCKGQVSDLVDLTTSPTNTPFLTFCLILNLGQVKIRLKVPRRVVSHIPDVWRWVKSIRSQVFTTIFKMLSMPNLSLKAKLKNEEELTGICTYRVIALIILQKIISKSELKLNVDTQESKKERKKLSRCKYRVATLSKLYLFISLKTLGQF